MRLQGLKLAYERLIGGSFEEMLKEADVAEARSPGAGGGNEHALRRVTKTSDVVLTQGPKVFNLAIGWESAQVRPISPLLLCDPCYRVMYIPNHLGNLFQVI